MLNVEMRCGVDLFVFKDREGYFGIVRDFQFGTGTVSIPHSPGIAYKCDAGNFIKVRDDGSIVIGASVQQIKSGAPLIPIKMCLWISGSYTLFGIPFLPFSFTSPLFQWPATPTQPQWIEGTADDSPNEEWIPEGSNIRDVWALRTIIARDANGRRSLVRDALQCSRI